MATSSDPPAGPDHESAAPGDQDAAFALLADRETHGLMFPVTRIDTHTAVVFLAGLDVYKVKRAVRFPFLDQSTLARRRHGCEAEVTVNRRYAPEIYLGAVPITRKGGVLRLGGDGEPVEWAVHMRRFDETRTLDHVAERGDLEPPLIMRLVETLLSIYGEAEVRDGDAATEALAGVVEETLASLAAMETFFPRSETAALAEAMTAAFAALRPLLLGRGRRGLVRRCHGDLHLRNITLLNGVPTPFDAIEFDEKIATVDILYDLAFLLMDLSERDLAAEANLVLNRYLWGAPDLAGELEGLAALPLFMSLRAAVRAKVEALRLLEIAEGGRDPVEAGRYFSLARTLMAGAPPRLVAVGGVSGTGKSTVAARLAPDLGRAPGAIHLRSDIERKRLLGAGEHDRLPEAAYAQPVTDRVFAALREQAGLALAAGQAVIVDAVHRRPGEREAIAAVATAAGVPFTGLWLEAPLDTASARVSARHGDASDATAAIVARQAAQPTGPIDWQRIDAGGSVEDVVAAAMAAIGGQLT